MAVGDLTTLDNVKGWLSPPRGSTIDDDLLRRLITAASQYIQTWLNRTIATTAYTDTFNGGGGFRLTMPNYPVSAVSAVTIDGIAIPLAAPGFATSGFLFDSFGLYLRGFQFTIGVQNITVSYSAGFTATPPELEQACIELVALRYAERDRVGQNSKTLAGEIIAFNTKDFSGSIQTILNNYKKVISL